MEHTKTTLIKVIKELQEEALTMAKAYREVGIETGIEHYKGKYLAFGIVINLLTDEDYYNRSKDAYKIKG